MGEGRRKIGKKDGRRRRRRGERSKRRDRGGGVHVQRQRKKYTGCS